jgi:hypothetical protein
MFEAAMIGGPRAREAAVGSLAALRRPPEVPGGAGSSSDGLESMVDGEPAQRKGSIRKRAFEPFTTSYQIVDVGSIVTIKSVKRRGFFLEFAFPD